MYATDPISVGSIRRADLMDAQAHHRTKLHLPPRRRRSPGWFRWPRTRQRSALDGGLELFVGLDQRTLRKLEQRFTILDLESGESLGRQGVTESQLTVVLDGRIGASLDGTPLTVFDRGSHFGALPLLDGGPGRFAAATYVVLEPTRVAIAGAGEFFEILRKYPLVGARIERVAERRRAYLRGHADATALAADRIAHPYPVHLTAGV